MAKPASREELIEYCKRQLGAPVLEINVSDEQVDDLVDDAFQYFQERHFDGIERMYLKYQLFLNDLYYFNSVELLQYAMVKSYLEDIDFLLTTEAQVRFNKRQDRLYLDINYNSLNAGDFIVIDCHRILDPSTYTQLFNDSFLKRYLTALIKRQWGQNLIKFQGVKLPGGIELNGRQIYDDALREIEMIKQEMSSTYELPPLDFIR